MAPGAVLAAALGALSVLALLRGLIPGRSVVLERLGPAATPSGPRSWGDRAGGWFGRLGRGRPARVLAIGPARTTRRLELAGSPFSLEVVSGMRVAGVGAAVAFAVLAVLVSPSLPIAWVLVAAVAWRWPDFMLARMARRRRDRIGAQVPDLVELLAATTQAGLSPVQAFRRSAEFLRGPLGEEARTVVAEVDLGAPWRMALDQLLARTESPPLRSLVRAVERSRRLGSPMSSTMRTLADDLRSEQRARAEELARRAPVKMLFPLVLLILPAFLLLTVGPVVLATLRSLH